MEIHANKLTLKIYKAYDENNAPCIQIELWNDKCADYPKYIESTNMPTNYTVFNMVLVMLSKCKYESTTDKMLILEELSNTDIILNEWDNTVMPFII